MQDVALLGKVFARGEGRVGDKVEAMTLGRCLQRERLGMPLGHGVWEWRGWLSSHRTCLLGCSFRASCHLSCLGPIEPNVFGPIRNTAQHSRAPHSIVEVLTSQVVFLPQPAPSGETQRCLRPHEHRAPSREAVVPWIIIQALKVSGRH